MKEWFDCYMDVCSSYKYGRDIGLERPSYQSKLFLSHQNITIIITGEIETFPVSEIAIIILSKVYRLN